MRRLVSKIHRWLGFCVGCLFIITFATGAVNALHELLERLDAHQLSRLYRYQPQTPAEQAAALTQLTSPAFNSTGLTTAGIEKSALDEIQLPTAQAPFYRLVQGNQSWLFAVDNLNQGTLAEAAGAGLFGAVLYLHRTFYLGFNGPLGINGAQLVAVVALLALTIGLLGVWLWWPRRRQFRWQNLVPRRAERRLFYQSHMSAGVVVITAMALFAVTGSGIAFYQQTRALLGVNANVTPLATALAVENSWPAWLKQAYQLMPAEAELRTVKFEHKNTGGANSAGGEPSQIELNFWAPGDWLGIANNRVLIEPASARIIAADRFSERPLSAKLYTLMIPLHTGHHLPLFYPLLLLLVGLLGSSMVASGLISFIVKPRRRQATKPAAPGSLVAKTLRRQVDQQLAEWRQQAEVGAVVRLRSGDMALLDRALLLECEQLLAWRTDEQTEPYLHRVLAALAERVGELKAQFANETEARNNPALTTVLEVQALLEEKARICRVIP
ncbi:PepSY-associated TM helix domain-containing protein [Halioxenophilus sp. WMMB6]|uniref:PepSY-associated TM helix domain-containing protein n=1 Tax=Halioxenophilus sp. WMMB6 TaxID=3073815 RepID=UPI00295EF6B6|nr:PepSY-associated TM helix domain-containing protein [Halioxenophilus sp. WMMB6]